MEIPYGTHLEVALSFSVTGYHPSDNAVVTDADLRKLIMGARHGQIGKEKRAAE
jgi:hypothetical protein